MSFPSVHFLYLNCVGVLPTHQNIPLLSLRPVLLLLLLCRCFVRPITPKNNLPQLIIAHREVERKVLFHDNNTNKFHIKTT